MIGSSIEVGTDPFGIAISPNQLPLASFAPATARLRPGVPVTILAAASKDPTG